MSQGEALNVAVDVVGDMKDGEKGSRARGRGLWCVHVFVYCWEGGRSPVDALATDILLDVRPCSPLLSLDDAATPALTLPALTTASPRSISLTTRDTREHGTPPSCMLSTSRAQRPRIASSNDLDATLWPLLSPSPARRTGHTIVSTPAPHPSPLSHSIH